MGRRILLLGGLGAPLRGAQPALAPCIASSEAGEALRLLFRAPAVRPPRDAEIVLLLHLRADPPARLRLNGRPAAVASQARGWAAVPLPRGLAWQRITVEPGPPFDGCSRAATAPYLVFEPRRRAKQ